MPAEGTAHDPMHMVATVGTCHDSPVKMATTGWNINTHQKSKQQNKTKQKRKNNTNQQHQNQLSNQHHFVQPDLSSVTDTLH
jgi:hypothetical protein